MRSWPSSPFGEPNKAWNTGSPSKRGMQHHTTPPCPSTSAPTEQLPISAKSSGQRGCPSVRTEGAGRAGPVGDHFVAALFEIFAARCAPDCLDPGLHIGINRRDNTD
jgi:hypothetical protein